MGLKKLGREQHLKLKGSNSIPDTNENHISLSLFDFEFDPIEISEQLQLPPTETGIRGEQYFIGPAHSRIKKTWGQNHWSYNWKIVTNEFIGDLMGRFVNDIIAPRTEILSKLSESSSIQFGIYMYYYDGCNPGIVIEKKIVKILAEIQAELDIDIYCLGE